MDVKSNPYARALGRVVLKGLSRVLIGYRGVFWKKNSFPMKINPIFCWILGNLPKNWQMK
jgi:hypothetical protein